MWLLFFLFWFIVVVIFREVLLFFCFFLLLSLDFLSPMHVVNRANVHEFHYAHRHDRRALLPLKNWTFAVARHFLSISHTLHTLFSSFRFFFLCCVRCPVDFKSFCLCFVFNRSYVVLLLIFIRSFFITWLIAHFEIEGQKRAREKNGVNQNGTARAGEQTHF